MKLLMLLFLLSCASIPQKEVRQTPPPCVTPQQKIKSSLNVQKLNKQLEIENDNLVKEARLNRELTQKFARLTEAYEIASPTSLPKLLARRKQLELQAKESDQRAQEIQKRLKAIKSEIVVESAQLTTRKECE